MIEFLRLFRPILPRAVKVRFAFSAGGALVLAGLEALGVVLVFPLVQTLDAIDGRTIPSSASWLADLFDRPSPSTVALVLAGIVFAAFLVKGVLAVVYLRWNFLLLARTEADLAARLLGAYLRAPWTFHLEHNTAEMAQHVHVSTLYAFQFGLANIISAMADAAVVAVVAVVLLAIDPWVALIAVAYMSVVAVFYRSIIVKRSNHAGERRHVLQADAFRGAQQSLGAVKELAITHRQSHFVEEVRTTKRLMARNEATLLLLGQLPRYYLEIALLGGIGVMSAVLFPLRSTSDAVAMLAVFLAAGFRLLPSLHRILATVNAVRLSLPPLRSVAADLTALEAIEAEAGSTPAGPTPPGGILEPGVIAFENVTFGYESSPEPVLRDVSFAIEPATSVAFVGASGVGKTTLIDLLLGLLRPDTGSITVGGRPIVDVLADWQRSIGYVPQDVALIDDSIAANIAFGYTPDEVDVERLTSAVRLAQLDELVASLPAGLATTTGEDGVRLSGGQRQRIGIARALYNGPGLLVLDEATSSLDSHTESLITSTVERLHGEITIVTISHRISTVRHHDKVFFLQRGGISGAGTFDELLEANAEFASLANLAGIG